MKIGNWIVGQDGIDWAGQFADNYYIEPDRMIATGSGKRSEMYDWLLNLTEKYWTTKKDILDVDAAFTYAVIKFDLKFNPITFANTLYEQNRIMEYTKMRH